MNNYILTLNNLVKQYQSITAVDGVCFNICAGEIFGLLGPNGAGKTTTLECIEGAAYTNFRGHFRRRSAPPAQPP